MLLSIFLVNSAQFAWLLLIHQIDNNCKFHITEVEHSHSSVMIKRTCLTLLSTIRGIRIETRTLAQSNKRLYLEFVDFLKMCTLDFFK